MAREFRGEHAVCAIFTGSTDCKAGYDTASLAVAYLGDSAQGGGWEAGSKQRAS